MGRPTHKIQSAKCPHCGAALTKSDMTDNQKRTYDFVADYINGNSISPSIEEIMVGAGFTSKSHVSYTLDRLEERGHIVREKFRARSIQLVL
jgi:SOS-response transcriptional repressor LexA